MDKSGDEFSIFFGETEWRFRITQIEPFEKIIWNCVKANHVHDRLDNIQDEWLDTTVVWNITEVNNQTTITVIHEGLTDKLNCFEVCKTGWDYYLLTSLRNYLESGKGNPFIG